MSWIQFLAAWLVVAVIVGFLAARLFAPQGEKND